MCNNVNFKIQNNNNRIVVIIVRIVLMWTSLVVQFLRLLTSTAGGTEVPSLVRN